MEKVVPDTSVLIDGRMTKLVESGELVDVEIIIPEAVLDELQAQASLGREVGFTGLEEVLKLRKIAKEKKGIKVTCVGERPTLEEIQLARKGRIDALIRDVARDYNATLITSDYVQALVAEAEGIRVMYIEPEAPKVKVKLEDFFTPDTMSVHLKEGVPPYAKRGTPGNWRLIKIRDEPCSKAELEYIVRDILRRARFKTDAFVEISRQGAMVIQLGTYRIAIARPPFSDGIEITAVRPIVKVTLEDYRLSRRLKRRLLEKAEGILICGPPGAGKSTFASALADFYWREKSAIVKTMEAPRDLQVGPEITQYAPLEGDFSKTADILLLVRPDYTIFDELRKSRDFAVFVDMRLAGVGMVGVVHASSPIDAIQRFLGRVDLGMVPQVIDTVIFIKDGEIRSVYELSLTVKVPHGMYDQDLARPVIEVRDFETGEVEYEIYTFGEETVVVPIKRERREDLDRVGERVLSLFKQFDKQAEVEMISSKMAVVRVRRSLMPQIIGRNGKVISKLEKRLGVRIKLLPKEEGVTARNVELKDYSVRETKSYLIFDFGKDLGHRPVDIYVDGELVTNITLDKRGRLKLRLSSELGKLLLNALESGRSIRFFT
ncbi:MAG: PINc/VapC family ATPase [archaeon GB-1867-005]|nr:PINc/VapC family ATPase [Candidatus Culexmicrobium cathedralense]